MDLIRKTENYIKKNSLLKNGDKVLLGVSGGPDSVALLYVLKELRHKFGFTLCAAHINHQLRKSASADQDFVQTLCESLSVSCRVLKIKVRGSSNDEKGSLEELAREKRLKSLVNISRKSGANIISLAHHKSDLAETVLMRLIRGSGLMGLKGFLPVRNIEDFKLIRPFIRMPKEEIIAFLKKNSIKFRTDPTNRNKYFLRNKIRLELLPLLKKDYNQNIEEALANLSNITAVDYDYLYGQGAKVLQKLISSNPTREQIKIKLSDFSKYHQSLQRSILRLGITRLKGDLKRITLTHILEMENMIFKRPENSTVNLPSGLCVTKTRSHLVLSIRKA